MQDNKTQDYIHRDTDRLETTTGAEADAPSAPRDSPSTEVDAGLDDETLEEAGLVNPLTAAIEADFDDAIPRPPAEEIPMSDLRGPGTSRIHSGEMDDLSSPGEVDIEDLDEDALDDTDLPPDARLDPLED